MEGSTRQLCPAWRSQTERYCTSGVRQTCSGPCRIHLCRCKAAKACKHVQAQLRPSTCRPGRHSKLKRHHTDSQGLIAMWRHELNRQQNIQSIVQMTAHWQGTSNIVITDIARVEVHQQVIAQCLQRNHQSSECLFIAGCTCWRDKLHIKCWHTARKFCCCSTHQE